MNKAELTNKIAEGAGLTKAQAAEALTSTLTAISDALKDGDKVTIPGFGTYSVNNRPARTGRNPRTGEPVAIAAKNVVKFKAGKELSSAVN